MTSFARRERAGLCDLLDAVGPDAPTLCDGWSTYDLAAHLVLREGTPLAAAGIVVPALEKVTDLGMRRLQTRRTYAELVQAVRDGPPWYSPMRPPAVDATINAMEFYVHHEDVRRAHGDHTPRDLADRDQRLLWALTRRMGPALARRSPVGIELLRNDDADGAQATARIRRGRPTVAVRGRPGELALFAYGRGAVAGVDISGDPTARLAVAEAGLGL